MATTFQDVRGGSRATPVGGPPPKDLVDAMKGTLREAVAARQEIKNVGRDMKVVAYRADAMGAAALAASQHAATIGDRIVESLTGVTDALVERVNATLVGAATAAQAASTAAEAAAERTREGQAHDREVRRIAPEPEGPATPARTPVDPASLGGRPDVDPAGGQAPESQLTNSELWSRGRGMDIGALRNAMAKGVSQVNLSRREIEYREDPATGRRVGMVQEHNGEWREATADDALDFAEYNERRAKTESRIQAYGDSVLNHGLRKAAFNALPGGIGKAAGIAGVALAVGNQSADWAQAQRQQNMAYRSVTGEGLGGALGDRLGNQQFQVGQRLRQLPFFGGGLGEQDAQRLYMGVTEAGLSDGQRENALDFATEQFRKFGMDVQTSLNLITAAARNGQPSLNGVAEALETVTDAAVQGGVNAKAARDAFASAYQQALPNFGGTGAAATVAGGATAAMAALGDQYVGQSNDVMSTTTMRLVAQASGTDFNDIVGMAGEGQGAEYLEQVDRLRVEGLSRTMGTGAQDVVRRFREQNPLEAGQNYSAEEMRALGAEIEAETGLDAEGVAMMLRNPVYGLGDVQVQDAYQMAAQIFSGNLNMGGAAREVEEQARSREITGESGMRNVAGRLGLRETAGEGGAKGTLNRYTARIAGRLEQGIKDPLGSFGIGDSGNDDEARLDYLDRVRETGRSSSNVEELLKGFDDSMRVKIRTKEGERVMTVEEAIKFAPEQLERGDAEIVESSSDEQEGQTVAEVFNNGMVDDSVDTAESEGRSSKRRFRGDIGEKYDAERDGKDRRDGVISVVPGPKLEQWFRFETQGAAFSPSTTPPRPSDTTGRPTGTPRIN